MLSKNKNILKLQKTSNKNIYFLLFKLNGKEGYKIYNNHWRL